MESVYLATRKGLYLELEYFQSRLLSVFYKGPFGSNILAHHNYVNDKPVFCQPTVSRFPKDIVNAFLPIREPLLSWSLNLGLTKLMSPYELFALASLEHLLIKMAFLIAITFARRISELGALMAIPFYIVVYKD